eukprot:1827163-Prymnesium_polylepis.1
MSASPFDASADDLNLRLTRARLIEQRSKAVRSRQRKFLNYNAASEWAQHLGLSTEADWHEWLDLGEGRTSYVPTDPEQHFTKRGAWLGWHHFLTGEPLASPPTRQSYPR